MPKVDVLICGRIYTIIGSESEEYIDKIARYVDRKMTAVAEGTSMRLYDQELIATLTSVNIGDELFKEIERSSKLASEIEQRDKQAEAYEIEMGKLQDENIALLEKISEMQLDMTYLKNQLQIKTEELSSLRKDMAMEKLNYEKKVENDIPKLQAVPQHNIDILSDTSATNLSVYQKRNKNKRR